ncbi:XRE family transcriptional regulator [Glaesserella parasuis]|uniref:XRE family transcriptional regulator n=1 Tax=Glaesserella parasuis TaxID=738 RepID=UPI0003AC41D8|nr:S24 family peptidase [Glaesserella parasuis]EQA05669.1 helix-turn-helix family protein [Glaesserella parasuis 12939]EQA13926.1 helix-turn-helix family protein [Glaesserella parasuis SW140]AMW17163.1 transcriptional regulator [Glaesserella parasuis]KDB50178.1 transcriptional regulator [Glaesserella parasuis HPS11]MCT8526845.1 helix-turn-helix domain-containing protein [Glaesserella parasuis]
MNTLSERLKFARTQANYTQVKLAEEVGVSQNTIQKIEKGGETKYVNQLAKALKVNPEWLQFGIGEMAAKTSDDVDVIDKDKDYSDTHISIDMYDIKLSAGNGKPVIEWVPRKSDEPLLFREAWFKVKRLSPKNCKAMYVRGHSMAPVLEDWDTVIVDISDTEIADGEVYAVVYNKHFYIKQIIRTGKGIQLVSFNPEYDPIDVMDDDLNNLQIIGRKVWRGG